MTCPDTPLRIVGQCEGDLRNPRAIRRTLSTAGQAKHWRALPIPDHLDVTPTQPARVQCTSDGEFCRKPDCQAFNIPLFAGRVVTFSIGKQPASQSIAVSVEKRFESLPVHEFDPHANDHWTAALRSRIARSMPTSSARDIAALPTATHSVAGTPSSTSETVP